MPDVVVIGAGFGGLSAATWLAASGRSVLVLEAGPRPGGKADVVEVDGVEVDTGPSVVTLVDEIDTVFEHAGARLRDEVELLRHERVFRYHWPDGVGLDVFFDPADTVASVRATLGDRSAAELEAFLAYARGIWDLAAPAFVYGEPPGANTVWKMRAAGLSAVRTLDPMRSMQRAIESYVTEPHLRDLLLRYATYTGSDPRRAPGTLNCIAHVELALGCWGIRGGLAALVRAFVRVLERHGGHVRTDARVARVLVEGGAIAGVELARGERVAARVVVANADVAHLVADLLPGVRHGLSTPSEPSTSGWNAIVRAPARDDRPPHEVLFPRTYAHEFRDLFDRKVAPEEPTVYLCAQARAHAREAWPGAEPVFVMANAPGSASGPSDAWRRLGDVTLERAVSSGLLTDAEVLWTRTPADLASRYPRTGGALYGAASNGMFSAFQRPPNRVTRVPGLYLASGSAHPGGGVPMCVLSGRAAARAILEDRP